MTLAQLSCEMSSDTILDWLSICHIHNTDTNFHNFYFFLFVIGMTFVHSLTFSLSPFVKIVISHGSIITGLRCSGKSYLFGGNLAPNCTSEM